MLNAGIIGLGFLGKVHLENLYRLEFEGYPVQLTAICDTDKRRLSGLEIAGNFEFGGVQPNLERFAMYTNIDDMLDTERLDFVVIALPTYLHADISIKAMNKGIHVLCEKPMALDSVQCSQMITAATKNGRKLMIGQCLRLWPEYEYLKQCVESNRYGNVLSGYFFRGSETPDRTYQNWVLRKQNGGGALLDMHVHDVDIINWLFGKPQSVSTMGKNVIPGSGHDIVSTHYFYEDSKVICAQNDWTLHCGFRHSYRVNFERATLLFEDNDLKIYPKSADMIIPELSKENAYYRELKYFADAIRNGEQLSVISPESTRNTILIVEAEMASADLHGQMMPVS